MLEELERKKHIAKVIRGGMGVISLGAVIPFFFSQALRTGGTSSRLSPQAGLHSEGYTELPPDHPLMRLAREVADRQNIKAEVFIIKEDKELENVTTCPVHRHRLIGKTKGAIFVFIGNPLKLPEGEKTAKAILGHELAHLKESDALFHKAANANLLASVTLFFASLVPGVLTVSGPMMKTALGLTAVAMFLLERFEKRNEEFIADLSASEEAGSPDANIRALEYAIQQRGPRPARGWLRNRLVESLSDHPSPESRIALLRKAFKINADMHAFPDTPRAVYFPR